MPRDQVLRRILTEVERDPGLSQRQLSEELDISLGAVNWHLKRCVTKGLIKLQKAPIKRYLYYLTPKGFAEKARLTADFLKASFDIFQTGRQQYEAVFNLCEVNGWRNIALVGDSELTELAMLVISKRDNITVHCILDPHSENVNRIGVPVVRNVQDLIECFPGRRVDALVGTHFELRVPGKFDIEAFQADLNLDRSCVFIPAFLQ